MELELDLYFKGVFKAEGQTEEERTLVAGSIIRGMVQNADFLIRNHGFSLSRSAMPLERANAIVNWVIDNGEEVEAFEGISDRLERGELVPYEFLDRFEALAADALKAVPVKTIECGKILFLSY